MKVVVMIPIKLNNERVPGKNLKCFSDGKKVDEVYVYCSNEAVKEYLLPGVKFLRRPEFLDTSVVNCNDIIREFMKEVEADIYIASHATGPFTRSESIDKCVEAVQTGRYDSAFLARRLQEFLWQNGNAMNFDIQNFPRTQDLVPVYSEAPGAYVFTKDTFLKYDRRVGMKPYICEISEIEARDIDYQDDFDIADAIYMKIIRGR